MDKQLIFATNNRHKLEEVEAILGSEWKLSTPKENGIFEEIPEEQPTIEGNAIQKAQYIFQKVGADSFADDTGLEVEALGGEPGVYSARYSGEGATSEKNIDTLLEKLQNVQNRKAQFRTVVALILDGNLHTFEGIVEGEITLERAGEGGFGYDSVFKPKGYDATFAELGSEIKNRISHRALAVEKLVNFLKSE